MQSYIDKAASLVLLACSGRFLPRLYGDVPFPFSSSSSPEPPVPVSPPVPEPPVPVPVSPPVLEPPVPEPPVPLPPVPVSPPPTLLWWNRLLYEPIKLKARRVPLEKSA